MPQMERKKIIEGLLGRTYYVRVVTDMEQGHLVQIFDENPDTEPEEIKVFGVLKLTIDPPPVQPLIERTYPLHVDIQRRIEELIYRHELPEIQLMRLDQWDGIVRPPKREPEPAEEPMRNPEPEPEPELEEQSRFLRIKDWRSPQTLVYDRHTGQWVEIDETETVEESG